MLSVGPYYVSRVAQEIFARKSIVDLTVDEFLKLFSSYNAVGASEATEWASRVAVDLYPSSIEIARIRSNAVLSLAKLEDARDEHTLRYAANTPHSCFYALSLADHLVMLAWGQDEECCGGEPESYGLLDEAAELLRDPKLRKYYGENFRQSGLNGRARRPFLFEEWFEPLYRFPRYTLQEEN